MTRICSWCGSLLTALAGSPPNVSHALCPDCLRDLQAGLGTQGLRLRTGEQSGAPR
jgi:hypothetical protein